MRGRCPLGLFYLMRAVRSFFVCECKLSGKSRAINIKVVGLSMVIEAREVGWNLKRM